MNFLEPVKVIDDLRRNALFVKIREFLASDEGGKKNHFCNIRYWDFLAGPRSISQGRGRGSEMDDTSGAASDGVEKRTGRLF